MSYLNLAQAARVLSLNPLTCSISQTSLHDDLMRAQQFGLVVGWAWLSEVAELEQLCKRCEAVDSNVIGEVP